MACGTQLVWWPWQVSIVVVFLRLVLPFSGGNLSHTGLKQCAVVNEWLWLRWLGPTTAVKAIQITMTAQNTPWLHYIYSQPILKTQEASTALLYHAIVCLSHFLTTVAISNSQFSV